MASIFDTAKKVAISIRLQKDLIATYKLMASAEGIRYQTLINQVLTRQVNEWKKQP